MKKLFLFSFLSFLLVGVCFAQEYADDGTYIGSDPGQEILTNSNFKTTSTASSLTTTFAWDNMFDGNMFDLDVKSQALIINGIDVNISSTIGPVDVYLYIKAGTYVGFEATPGAWTLFETYTSITAAGSGSPTHLDVSGLELDALTTYGVYLTVGEQGAIPGDNSQVTMHYTDDNPGPILPAENTDLKINVGAGIGGLFVSLAGSGTGLFPPRLWNGTFYYDYNCPDDIVVDNDPGVCGAVVDYDTPPGTPSFGLASGSLFPVGTTTNVFTSPDCSFSVTVEDVEEPVVICPSPLKLFGTVGFGYGTTSTLVEIDPETGNTVQTIGSIGYLVNGLTYDATNDKLYGGTAINDPNFQGLIEIDITTGVGTPVGAPNWGLPGRGAVVAITVNSSGQMFGWLEPGIDDLVSIDKSTGIASIVGESGLNTAVLGLTFDNTGTLHLINYTGEFYTINTSTGASSLMGSIGTTAHHGVFHPESGNYIGINVDPYNKYAPRTLLECDLSTTTVSSIGPVGDLHTLAFVGTGQGSGDNFVVSTDRGLCSYLNNGTEWDATASDNCGVTSLTYTLEGATTGTGASLDGVVFEKGVTTVTWTAIDGTTLSSECSFTVTVEDNELPEITCPNPLNPYVTDMGECDASLSFTFDATDNCGVDYITYTLDGTNYTLGTAPYEFSYDFLFGTYTITAVATDVNGNDSDPCSFDVIVDEIATVLEVDITPYVQHYSDLVTFTADVTPWDCEGFNVDPGEATGTVEFFIESDYGIQSMGVAPVIDGTATLSDVALLEKDDPPFLEGVLDPGVKDIRAVYTSTNINYLGSEDLDEDLLTITQEDASAAYVGVMFQATPAAGESSAEVMLMATVQGELDGYPGDIRNACVTFALDGGSGSGAEPMELVAPLDPTLGVATLYVDVPIGVYTVNVYVGCYYLGSTESVLTVYEPVGDFITGGGYIIPDNAFGTNSYGTIGSNGLHWNYGFNVKYNKKGKKLKGHINLITRADDGRVYQIKSNAMASLGVDISDPEFDIAVYTAKANLTDVTDEEPVGIAGNLILKMTMTDYGEPGVMDMIGWTLWSSTGGKNPVADELLLSSDWNGMDTDEQTIVGGNLVVHSEFSVKSQPILSESSYITADLNIYPNPFSDRTCFEFSAATDSRAKLDIFDVTGRKLATLIDQNVKAGQLHRIDYQPGLIANGILFYTLSIDNEVKTGKLIHKR